jgi:hypothetical protein
MTIGLTSQNTLRYTGIPVSVAPMRGFPKIPDTNDRRFVIGQFVIIQEDPIAPAVEGDLYYLSKFDTAGDPVWKDIEIHGSTGGFIWETITASQTIEVKHGYFCDTTSNSITLTLPSPSKVGEVFVINRLTASNTVTIAQQGSQQILFGTSSTTPGITGSLIMNDIGDSVRIVYAGSDIFFVEYGAIGNITVT